MALSIKDPKADRLARELAAVTGESLTSAVEIALVERLERVRGATHAEDLATQLADIARRASGLPVLDTRTADDIVGYDRHGIPA